jgi:hypothetical protein
VLVNNENLNGHYELTPDLVFANTCHTPAAEAYVYEEIG